MADNQKGIPFSSDDEGTDIPKFIRQMVFDWAAEGLGVKTEHPTFSMDEVYVVWFCYILGGWKALCSTSIPDGRYYEVTFKPNPTGHGDGYAFIDTYMKTHNVEVKIGGHEDGE